MDPAPAEAEATTEPGPPSVKSGLRRGHQSSSRLSSSKGPPGLTAARLKQLLRWMPEVGAAGRCWTFCTLADGNTSEFCRGPGG